MFHTSILQIQEELQYHQQQQEQLEQQLYQLKAYEEFASQAFEHVRDTIGEIQDDKYVNLFRESLLSLFDTTTTTTTTAAPNTQDDIEYMDDSDPNYQSIEQIEKEEPDNIVVYPYEVKDEEKKPKKTHLELYGRPDFTPETYDDLTPNITYSSSGRCYVGFNDYQEAESFREQIEEPSLLDAAEIMNSHDWEVKFYCEREYLDKVIELKGDPILTTIAPDIVYSSDGRCYLGFGSRARASNYGAVIKEVHEFTTSYTVASPVVMKDHRWELQFMCSKDNALRLAPLNLKKELEHEDNKAITQTWVHKEVAVVSNKGYEKVQISELELADVIAKSPHGQAFFEVDSVRKEGDELYAYVKCIEHSIFPGHVNEYFSFKDVYLVSKGDIREVS